MSGSTCKELGRNYLILLSRKKLNSSSQIYKTDEDLGKAAAPGLETQTGARR
jgi:hypothetical protein